MLRDASQAGSTTTVEALSFHDVTIVLLVLCGALVVIAFLIIYANAQAARAAEAQRKAHTPGRAGGEPAQTHAPSLIRPLIALWATAGLLILGVVAFGISDTSLRNLLIGGLVATTSSATAFYFSSRSADQARQDLLSAAKASAAVKVPHLVGRTVSDARGSMAQTPLELLLSDSLAPSEHRITSQSPSGGSVMERGGVVHAVTAPRPPEKIDAPQDSPPSEGE